MKTIGLIFLFISSLSFGIMCAQKTKSKINFTHELLRLMNHSKNQIHYFNTPTNEIFESFSPKDKHFKSFIQSVDLSGKEARSGTLTLVPPEIENTIEEYTTKLGKSSKTDQIALIERCEKEIEKYYKELTEQAPNKIKLSLSLGVYCGLMLIILFI